MKTAARTNSNRRRQRTPVHRKPGLMVCHGSLVKRHWTADPTKNQEPSIFIAGIEPERPFLLRELSFIIAETETNETFKIPWPDYFSDSIPAPKA